MTNQGEKGRVPEMHHPLLSSKIHPPPLVSSAEGNGGSSSGNPPLNSLPLPRIPAALYPPVSSMFASNLPTSPCEIIQTRAQAETSTRPPIEATPSNIRIPGPYFRVGWNKDPGQRGFILPHLPPILPMVNNTRASWYTPPRLSLAAPPYYRSDPTVGRPQVPITSRPNNAGMVVTHPVRVHQTGMNNFTSGGRFAHFPPVIHNPMRFENYGKAEPAPIASRNIQRNVQGGYSRHPPMINETEANVASQSIIVASNAQNTPAATIGLPSNRGDTAEIVSAASGLMSIRKGAVRKPDKRVRKRAPVRNKKAINAHNGIDTPKVASDAAKLFACQLCPENLKRKFDLKKHIEVVHWKLKQHKCPRPKCNARFGHKGTLTKHLNGFHDKKKPHKCRSQGCDMAFSEKGNLNKHIRSKHPKL